MKASSEHNFMMIGTNGLYAKFVFQPDKKEIHIQYTDLINNPTEVISEDKRVISSFEHSIETIQKSVGEAIRYSFSVSN